MIGTPPYPDEFEQACAREEAESHEDAYAAFRETEPCHRCGEGESWTVKGPDGLCIGQSWIGDDAECDAEEMAVALNGGPFKQSMKPLAIDLFCGLGGWTEGLLEEGYYVVGFDNHQHVYGEHRYPAQLVIQDVLTIHGSQFKDAALIVASPPCQAYSYRAMPWKRAKALPPPDNSLFQACFRIQSEACEAAGRYVPLVVENVRGAQKWVGRSRWNYGSFHLWGDVPALMPMVRNHAKVGNAADQLDHIKVAGGGKDGWFGADHPSPMWRHHSGSAKRKLASAMIAKIPAPLARYIARTYFPSAKACESK